MVSHNLAAASVVALLLAACGGGSPTSQTQNTDTTLSTNTNQPATSTDNRPGSQSTATANMLVGSNGDLSKYLGTWKSECEVHGESSPSAPASNPSVASPGIPASNSSVAIPGAPASSPSDSTASGATASGATASRATAGVTYIYGISSVVFLSVSGNTLAGVSTEQSYEDMDCTKPMSNPYDGTRNLTLTYLGNAALTANEKFSGTADNISISEDGSAKSSTGYLGFDPKYGKFFTSESTTFDKDSSALIKQ